MRSLVDCKCCCAGIGYSRETSFAPLETPLDTSYRLGMVMMMVVVGQLMVAEVRDRVRDDQRMTMKVVVMRLRLAQVMLLLLMYHLVLEMHLT